MTTAFKKTIYVLIDVFLILLALLLTVWVLKIDWQALLPMDKNLFRFAPLLAIPTFLLLGLYDAVLRYLSFKAVFTVLKSVAVFGVLWALLLQLLPNSLPSAMPFVLSLLLLVLIGGSRLLRSWQFAYFGDGYGANKDKKNVLIYGAGTAGAQLATLLSYGNQYVPHGFIDDASNLQDRVVEGFKVYSSEQVQSLIDKFKVDEILMAIPSASRGRRKKILKALEPLNVHIKSLPSLEEIVNCEVKIDDIREVDMMDLLGRDPVPADNNLLEAPILDKVVMVTGAAGSIGSELCRQIIKHAPKCLILFEQHEFSLYSLTKELEKSDIKIVPLLGSVQDGARVKRLLAQYKVDTVYHAAAYKHVPMVEHNPAMGVLNNVLGTLALAEAVCESEVQNFVLISTDKAVRPTNIMGATKRVAELVVQAMDAHCETVRFSAVRFGNVIGSSGSVIPLFREQIRSGGPVTVTHREITRYFMTVPEAAQLVIQAGALGKGGDIFVLDMGKPIKIDEMAKHMIRLSGLSLADKSNPDGDIEIVYHGLRSGEKLFEELLIDGDVSMTQHSRIMRAQEAMLTLPVLSGYIKQLAKAANKGDTTEIKKILAELVDGYSPSS